MGMSTSVKGLVQDSEEYQKRRAAYLACREARVTPPEELIAYFSAFDQDFADGEDVPVRAEVEIPSREWQDDYRAGIEVDVAALPPNVTTIRFYNSW